ncbi:hypothetical protein [uncultured Acetobacteroides sp.]|uniref:hypothetical protein n=1 Tax=uncultured Acetobacteroides sp. TaxID=1760811 RepID=UPI0029F4CCC4|nr:hypothetical protein [uncultured Acetobacteroides sp.]
MKHLKFILVAVAIATAVTISWGQGSFHGSIKFKIYAVGKPVLPLFDSAMYTYCSNGFFIEHVFDSDPSHFQFEKMITDDSTNYTQFKGESNTILISKASQSVARKVETTDEFQTILNHRCQKYIVKRLVDDSTTITENWWIASDLKLAGNYPRKLEENPGCPLKYELLRERRDGKKGYIEVFEAVEIRPSDVHFDLESFLKGKNVTTKNPLEPFFRH